MATVAPQAVTIDHGNAAWLYTGADERGRELEVIAVEVAAEDAPPFLLVIHVMPTSLRRHSDGTASSTEDHH